MRVRIIDAKPLSPTVKLYTLGAVKGDYSFQPGQFISFLIPRESGQSVRAYSFCSLPDALPRIELCVREVPGGVGTTYLRENIGSIVKTSGPQGEFVLPQKEAPLVFLASGTGIAPVRPMLKMWLEQIPDSPVQLFYRHKADEYLFDKELQQLAEKYPSFKLNNWQEDLADFSKLSSPQFFIVGPPNFVSQNTGTLKKRGYNKEDIVYDIWE